MTTEQKASEERLVSKCFSLSQADIDAVERVARERRASASSVVRWAIKVAIADAGDSAGDQGGAAGAAV